MLNCPNNNIYDVKTETHVKIYLICACLYIVFICFLVYTVISLFLKSKLEKTKILLALISCIALTLIPRILYFLGGILCYDELLYYFFKYIPALFKDTALFCLSLNFIFTLSALNHKPIATKTMLIINIIWICIHAVLTILCIFKPDLLPNDYLRVIINISVGLVFIWFIITYRIFMSGIRTLSEEIHNLMSKKMCITVFAIGLIYCTRICLNAFDYIFRRNHLYNVDDYMPIILAVQFSVFEAFPCFLLIIVMSTANDGNEEVEQSLLSKK